MSLYHVIFGESASADRLLQVLELSREDFYRYRDCYLTEAGEIAVYTRGGGGNRECFCDGEDATETVEVEGERHGPWCVVVKHHRLRQHPAYLRDEDDRFDATYRTFFFRVPDHATDQLATVEPEASGEDRWRQFFARLWSSSRPPENAGHTPG